MATKIFLLKVRKKLWYYIVSYFRAKKLYPYLYKSYWYYLFHNKYIKTNNSCYYGARPNNGAGIGHQIANWIAGYWFAKQFGLKFAHIPFSQSSWDTFLGFGDNEITAKTLIKEHGYKKVLLPLFDEFNSKEVELNKSIIAAYNNKKIVFVPEQDQFYSDQFGNIAEIKGKFYNTKARLNDKLSYSNENFNVAIHVRRGDIADGQLNDEQYAIRWQTNEYFETVLSNVIENFNPKKPIAIYLFSQGERSDFPDFEKFENIYFCLEMGAQDSFLHMVYADLLITSKSSFSYKPALLNNGIKICPRNFWHSYPEDGSWILVENDGSFNVNELKTILLK